MNLANKDIANESLLELLRENKPLYTSAKSTITGRPLFSADRHNTRTFSIAKRDPHIFSSETINYFMQNANDDDDDYDGDCFVLDEDNIKENINKQSGCLDSVVFQNLVADNSDDIMIEGWWIEKEPISIDNDVSKQISMTETPALFNKEPNLISQSAEIFQPDNNVRKMLYEILGLGDFIPDQAQKNSKLSFKSSNSSITQQQKSRTIAPLSTRSSFSTTGTIRQSLAKQRRDILNLTRIAVLNEKIASKQSEREAAFVAATAVAKNTCAKNKCAVVEKWESEVALRCAKNDFENIFSETRAKAHEEREAAIKAQQEKIKVEELTRYKIEQERRSREERERKRVKALAKVEELFMMKTLKLLS
ncbi:hypothetical protein HK100_009859, partial [Physocladia obscura]